MGYSIHKDLSTETEFQNLIEASVKAMNGAFNITKEEVL